MPFRKFFGRGNDAPAPAPPVDEAELPDEDADEENGIPEALPNEDEIDQDWRARAAGVIPGGSSTGSKRPAALYGDATTTGPSHYLRATGCQLVTASERSVIDCTMALGAVSLGYSDDAVVRAVVQAVANGNVAGLAHVHEVEIAERLCDVIPLC